MKSFHSLNEKLAIWRALQPLSPSDDARLWEKLRLELNYHSNRIEGNTLTYGETELLLIHDQASGDHSLRCYIEMKAHDVAISHLQNLVESDQPLGAADIRDLNRILLKEPFTKPAITADGRATTIEIQPGAYKTLPNNVRTASGDIFEFAAPVDVSTKIDNLISWLRIELAAEEIHPVEMAAKLHHEFVLIHPFGDGNGRTARLLVNYVLMRCGFPPTIIQSGDRDRYFAVLRLADAGDLDPLIFYLESAVETALKRGIAAGSGEDIEEPDDIKKEIEVFRREKQLDRGAKPVMRTEDLVLSIYESSIIPFFNKAAAEFCELQKLFLYAEVNLKVEGDEFTNEEDAIPLNPRSLELSTLSGAEITKIKNIDAKITYKTFQGNEELSFEHVERVCARFDDYGYSVQVGGARSPIRPYNRPLVSSEIESLVSIGLKAAFVSIKARTAASP